MGVDDAGRGALSDAYDCSDWIITLVHGTWGRGFFPNDKPKRTPRWFEARSEFRENLRFWMSDWKGEPTIEGFLWSGSNSISERDDAGQRLAKALYDQRRRRPDAKQLVVAHSHGGNVALRALAHLDTTGSRLLIASLACPFVEVFPSRIGPALRRGIIMVAVLFVIALPSLAYWEGPAWLEQGWIAWAYFGAIVGVGAAVTLRKAVMVQKPETFEERMIRQSSHSAFESGDAELLVLRGVDDEASLVLAAGAISSRITTFVADSSFSVVPWYTLCAVASVAILIVGEFLGHSGYISEYSLFATTAVWFFAYSLILIAATFWTALFLSAVCRSVYGRELLFRVLDAEISTNSVPDTYRGVTVHTVVRRGVQSLSFINPPPIPMRHSLYNESTAAKAIAFWARCRFANEVPSWGPDTRRESSPP